VGSFIAEFLGIATEFPFLARRNPKGLIYWLWAQGGLIP
jgi:hypothetical protein